MHRHLTHVLSVGSCNTTVRPCNAVCCALHFAHCVTQSEKTLRDELKAVEQAALAAQAADAQLFGWGSSAAAASSSSSSSSTTEQQQQYGSAKVAPPPPPPPPPLPMEAAAPARDRGSRSDAAAAALEDASIEKEDDGCYQVIANCNLLK
jgi:hypothetical protein